MDKINEFLKKNYHGHKTRGLYSVGEIPEVTKRIECNDGFSISVQANNFAYCMPREDKAWPYSEVDDLIEIYGEEHGTTETIYPYVPIDIVNELIEKHGGIANE